jgi:hypothetical protein
MSDTLFAITSDKNTRHYRTENFGRLLELLDLLREVKTAKERIPTITASDAYRLVMYSKSMLPISSPSLRLFKALEPEEFAEKLHQFQTNPTEDRHVVLDYDGNRFASSEWTEDGLGTLSGPLDGVISAYAGALRKKNSYQTYLNQKVFAAKMESICTVSNAPLPSEQTENSPEIKM